MPNKYQQLYDRLVQADKDGEELNDGRMAREFDNVCLVNQDSDFRDCFTYSIFSDINSSLQVAHRLLPNWLWRLQYNGTDYTYTTHNQIMAGEYAEHSSGSMCVAVIVATVQALAHIHKDYM